VPYVRGRERSLPGPVLVDQVRRLADAGVREVVFLGQTVNAYRDADWDFARLPRQLGMRGQGQGEDPTSGVRTTFPGLYFLRPDRTGDLDPDVGLCSCCRWARVHGSKRGGRFWRCTRAETDARFVRHPRLAVVRCAGYEEPSAG
jgi:hypothetical protein